MKMTFSVLALLVLCACNREHQPAFDSPVETVCHARGYLCFDWTKSGQLVCETCRVQMIPSLSPEQKREIAHAWDVCRTHDKRSTPTWHSDGRIACFDENGNEIYTSDK